MNLSKKIISLILSILIVFSLSFAAFAGSVSSDKRKIIDSSSLTPLRTGYTALDKYVDKIIASKITASMDTCDKVKTLYDYCVYNSTYGVPSYAGEFSRATIDAECGYYSAFDLRNASMAYAFLKTKTGTCVDFAAAFMVLTRAIGLETYVIDGTYSGGDHTWCLTKIGNYYYGFDTQAEFRNYESNGSVSYSNFCVLESQQSSKKVYSRSTNIAKFGNFKCSKKTNNPGATVSGTTYTYTAGIYVTSEVMYLRESPSASSTGYCTIPANTKLSITAISNGDWGKTTYKAADGKTYTGWMNLAWAARTGDLTTTNTSSTSTATASGTYTTGVYKTKEVMNLRAAASESATIYFTIPAGTTLNVTEIKGAWGKVVYNSQSGWMNLTYSTRTGDLPSSSTSGYKTGYYRTDATMNLRKSASTDGDYIASIPYGATVEVKSVSGDWGKVTYGKNTGWMCLNYSTYLGASGSASAVASSEDAVDWLVIDVSYCQEERQLDWAKLKKGGVKGVIIRLGTRLTSTLETDSAFLEHYKAATAAGLYIGVYFYSGAISAAEAKAEAEYTIKVLKANNCSLTMPVYIDIEPFYRNGKLTNPDTLGKNTFTAIANSFCATIESAGYYAGVYTSKSYAEDFLDSTIMSGRSLWIAQYNDACTYKGSYGMWQYSNKGLPSGYTKLSYNTSETLDMNHCYVNYPNLIKKMQAEKETTTKAAETTTKKAEESTTKKDSGLVDVPAGGDEKLTTAAETTTLAPSKTGETPVETVGEWIIRSEADCENDGERAYIENNRTVKTEIIPSGHQNIETCIVIDSDCIKSAGEKFDTNAYTGGYYTDDSGYYLTAYMTMLSEGGAIMTYCLDCGEVLSVEKYLKSSRCDHTSTETKTVTGATCSTEGLEQTVCVSCGAVTAEEILPKNEHKQGDTIEVSACGSECAYYATVCSVCKKTIAKELILMGDADGDGVVSAADARIALRVAVAMDSVDEETLLKLDMDGNGEVNSADARLVLRGAVGLS